MKYNCLIIDDEKVLADSTTEYFNLFGVNTVAVYSVEDCRKFFKNNTAELILLDINLGDGNGFELCKELRETTNIPILFISVRTSDDDKIVAFNIGGGVLEEELLVIKEKFKRGSNSANIEGAGLGLYISDYFMKEMHGELNIENGEHGLEVTVTLCLNDKI